MFFFFSQLIFINEHIINYIQKLKLKIESKINASFLSITIENTLNYEYSNIFANFRNTKILLYIK